MYFSFRDKQRGVALIIALVVVALVTLLAVTVSGNFLVNFRQVQNQQLLQQAWAYFSFTEGVGRWGLMKDLEQDAKDSHKSDYLGEGWDRPAEQEFQHSGVTVYIRGQLVDLQGKFNLNSLKASTDVASGTAHTVAQERFIRLLQTFEKPEISTQEAIAITSAVSDWIDENDQVTGLDGAEDLYYADQAPPGRPANNGAIASVSELRWVKGMTPELYHALRPHVTVWPLTIGSININTATDNVLRSFNEDRVLEPLSEIELETLRNGIIGFDPPEPPQSPADLGGRQINLDGTVIKSDWFLLLSRTELLDREFNLASVINRKSEDEVVVVARSLGEF